MPVVTQEAVEPQGPPSREDIRTPEPTAAAERVPENPAFDGIPEEVLLAIGVYDTDCAGGCG